MLIGATLLGVVSLFLIISAFSSGQRGEVPGRDVHTIEPPPRGPDLGRGEPNDFCATNRLGESFVLNGTTYTCKGPKPYRWRADEK